MVAPIRSVHLFYSSKNVTGKQKAFGVKTSFKSFLLDQDVLKTHFYCSFAYKSQFNMYS